MELLEIINLNQRHDKQAAQVADGKKPDEGKKPKVFQGSRLKWARDMKKLTQDELTVLLEVGQQQVSRWETGVSEPDSIQVVKMAKVLDVTTDWLYGLSEDAESSKRPNENLTAEQKLLLAQYEAGEFEELAFELLKKSLDRKRAQSSAKSRAKHPNGGRSE